MRLVVMFATMNYLNLIQSNRDYVLGDLDRYRMRMLVMVLRSQPDTVPKLADRLLIRKMSADMTKNCFNFHVRCEIFYNAIFFLYPHFLAI